MRKKGIYLGCLMVLILGINCSAQFKKNAVVVECLGKSLYVGGAWYQRNFSEKFYAGTGVSIPFHEYSIADDYNYTNKWMPLGSWHIFNVPVYCGYSFGKKKHHINSELGIVLHYGVQDKQLLFLTSRPFFSVGYEFKGEKFLFGIPVYMGLSEKINGNRIFMRWPGIRLGRKF